MDLSNLAISQDGFKVFLTHPVTGEFLFCDSKEPKQMYIEIRSQDSEEFRRATSKMLRKSQNDKGRVKEIDLDVTWRDSAELLSSITTGCYLFIDGKVIKDAANISDVYCDNRFKWIKEQVERASAERSNFIKG